MYEEKHAYLKVPLNLPQAPVKLEHREGKLSIFDTLRKKFLILTPEEWVRQHIIHFLIEFKKYPRGLFALEKGLKYNQMQKRFDVLVLDRSGFPFLLVECKAPQVKLTQKTVEQVALYNKTLLAQYICISNGNQHFLLKKEPDGQAYLQINSFPDIT
ncbi:type I restriction enzyme HsdR N-terminal domain-containing protein [Pararhodonellum marinum]|uniref:type I restriction enzyme HsdR N-terminal domain-containing protein n=1 Tax=Pararhodonellum marinum TaxID=2755358 RepID=UPI00188DE966|nr:type I restriction enzyme HsdR N-terminal domain-containing protein [Pararhodonellum marinum]